MGQSEEVKIHDPMLQRVALEKARESHEAAFKKLSEKKGNMISTADKLRELGAKTEKRLTLNGKAED